MPLDVRVAGPTPHRFALRLARVPARCSPRSPRSAPSARSTSRRRSGLEGLDLQVRFDLGARRARSRSRRASTARGAGTQAVLYLLALTDFLARTDLAAVDLRRVEVELVPYAEPRAATLVGLHAERAQVEPGDVVDLLLDVRPWRGEAERLRLPVRLPADLPAGRYTLLVGDGASVDAARLALEPVEPVTLAQALALPALARLAEGAAVLGVIPGRGLATGGELLPRLPGSLRSIWSASGARNATPLRLAVAQRERFVRSAPLAGLLRLDLEVRRPEPLGRQPRRGDPADGRGNGRRRACKGGEMKGVLGATLASALVAAVAAAAPVRVIQTQTQAAFLAGKLDGVSVDARGVLALADRSERVASLEEPFAFAFAPLPDGWAVGTGNDGKVLEVGARREGEAALRRRRAARSSRSGPTATAPCSPAPRPTAGSTASRTAAARSSSSRARPTSGRWRAAPTARSGWRPAPRAASTGSTAAGKGEVAFDSEETHLRSLLPLPGGDVLVGTATAGLVLRWRAAGKSVRTLYDSALSEVVALAAGRRREPLRRRARLRGELRRPGAEPAGRGGFEERRRPPAGAAAGGGAEPKAVVVDVDSETARPRRGSRPAGAGGPRSEVVRIAADGAVEPSGASHDETVVLAALPRDGARLWVGTGRRRQALLAARRARRASRRTSRSGRSSAWSPGDERARAAHHQRRRGLALRAGAGAARHLHERGARRRPGRALRRLPLARRRARGRARRASPSAAASRPSPIAPGRRGARRPRGASCRSARCDARPLRAVARSSFAGRRPTARRDSTRPRSPTGRRTCARRSSASPRSIPARSWCRPAFNPGRPGLRAGEPEPRRHLHHARARAPRATSA